MSSFLKQITPAIYLPVLTVIVLGGTWQATVMVFHVPSWLLPTPYAILKAFFHSPALLGHTKVTCIEFLLGFGISIGVGISYGILISRWRTLREATYPFLIVVSSLPASSFAPLLAIWLGYGVTAKIVVSFILSFFAITTSTVTGIKEIPQEIKDAARVDGAGFLRRIRSIELPLALPSIMIGLRIGWSMALVGAVVSELYGAKAGLGYLIMFNVRMFRVTGLFTAVLMLSLISIAGFELVGLCERRLVKW